MDSSSECHLSNLLKLATEEAVKLRLRWHQETYIDWTFPEGLRQGPFKERKRPFLQGGGLSSERSKQIRDEVAKIAPEFWDGAWIFSGGSEPVLVEILYSFIEAAWNMHGSRMLEMADAFDHQIERFVKFIQTRTSQFSFIGPLQNVAAINTPSGDIRLADDLVIRQLSALELYNLWGTPVSALAAQDHPVGYAIVKTAALRWHFGRPNADIHTRASEYETTIRDLEKAIRLVKGGRIGCHLIYSLPVHPVLSVGRKGGGDCAFRICPYDPVSFHESDEANLRSVWPLVSKGVEEPLRLAMDRLSLAETRVNGSDQILDAVIGLESLLLYRERDAKSYKFALRYGFLVTGEERRLQRFNFARTIYSARSAIAHGETIEEVEVGLADLGGVYGAARFSCDMLREVINRFLISEELMDKEYWMRLTGQYLQPGCRFGR